MASSKNLFLLVGLLLAFVLLIASQVAADESNVETGETELDDNKHGGYPGKGHGPGHGGYPGKGGGHPGKGGGYPGRGGGHPGKGCKYGCCRGYRYGPGCKRCCATANEAPDAEFDDDHF